MKVIAAAFILLATALVDTAPAGGPSKHQQRHLRQIIDSAKALLKDEDLPGTKEILETFVSSSFNRNKCECKDFSMATKILAPTLKHTNYKLARALRIYTMHYESHSDHHHTSASLDQYHLMELVKDVLHCAKDHMHANHSHCPETTNKH